MYHKKQLIRWSIGLLCFLLLVVIMILVLNFPLRNNKGIEILYKYDKINKSYEYILKDSSNIYIMRSVNNFGLYNIIVKNSPQSVNEVLEREKIDEKEYKNYKISFRGENFNAISISRIPLGYGEFLHLDECNQYAYDISINKEGMTKVYVRAPDSKMGNYKFKISKEELKSINKVAYMINSQKVKGLSKDTLTKPVAIVIDNNIINNTEVTNNLNCSTIVALTEMLVIKYVEDRDAYSIMPDGKIISFQYLDTHPPAIPSPPISLPNR